MQGAVWGIEHLPAQGPKEHMKGVREIDSDRAADDRSNGCRDRRDDHRALHADLQGLRPDPVVVVRSRTTQKVEITRT